MMSRAVRYLGLGALGAVMAACGEDELSLLPPSSSVAADELCTVFCDLMWTHCHDVWRPYPTVEMCAQACPSLPQTGSLGDLRGNTVQCRLTYVLYARRLPQRQAYCREAWPDGGSLCVNTSSTP